MTNNATLLVKNKLEAVQLTIKARGREKTGRKFIHSFERGTATAHPSSFLYNLHSVIQRPGFWRSFLLMKDSYFIWMTTSDISIHCLWCSLPVLITFSIMLSKQSISSYIVRWNICFHVGDILMFLNSMDDEGEVWWHDSQHTWSVCQYLGLDYCSW